VELWFGSDAQIQANHFDRHHQAVVSDGTARNGIGGGRLPGIRGLPFAQPARKNKGFATNVYVQRPGSSQLVCARNFGLESRFRDFWAMISQPGTCLNCMQLRSFTKKKALGFST
jgi:hypothetical protein